MVIKRILVPMDFSEASTATLKYAVELAAHFPATVHVLHVIEAPSNGRRRIANEGLTAAHRLRAARRRLHRFIPRIAGVEFGVDRDVRVGDVAERIVECAREELADLIVMRCGHASSRKARGGCTVDRVTHTAPCPVMTLVPEVAGQ